MTRILLTGARDWTDEKTLYERLLAVSLIASRPTLVHGAAIGADLMADMQWMLWGLPIESHPAYLFRSPRERNQHMVDLGARVCVTFATRWASGTGMCARMARLAGIETIDYGVDTRIEARP